MCRSYVPKKGSTSAKYDELINTNMVDLALFSNTTYRLFLQLLYKLLHDTFV